MSFGQPQNDFILLLIQYYIRVVCFNIDEHETKLKGKEKPFQFTFFMLRNECMK
jgi:hypothetical protein